MFGIVTNREIILKSKYDDDSKTNIISAIFSITDKLINSFGNEDFSSIIL